MDGTAPTRAVGEAWRALVPRRSELRRASDRLELATRWVVLVLVLLTVPHVLAFAGTIADGAEQRAAHATHITHATVTRLPATAAVAPSGPGAPTGSRVDGADRPAARPHAPGEGWVAGAVVVVIALSSVALAASLTLRSVRWLLDRGRLRDWEREWAVLGRLGSAH